MTELRRDALRIVIGPEFAEHLRSRTPLRLAHSLGEHPLLALESVARLAESLGEQSISRDAAVKPLVTADNTSELAAGVQAAELIRALDGSDAWLTLLNIEQHPDYRRLMDELLDAVAHAAGLAPHSIKHRAGFVFASSPRSVTSAHFDIEHSLLIQLRGSRTLSFGEFADDASREAEVHRYWAGSSYGRMQSMPTAGQQFRLEPGVGAYIPPFTPHWIQNEDAPSLSLTMVFFDRSNEDETNVQVFNEKMRSLHLRPRPQGGRPRVDAGKALVMRGYTAARRRLRPPKPAQH